ncbi:MAG: ABC transporter permease [Syntrophomonadaceae bacterium]
MNKILTKKSWRYVKHNKGQFLAVAAVIMVGITVFIAMNTSYFNLKSSQQSYYQRNNFADYYFQVVKAPESITRQIEALPGVKRVTGRVQIDVALLKDNHERGTVRMVSFTAPGENELNRLTLLQGSNFGASGKYNGIEVLLDPQFAAAHHLKPGDTTAVIVNNRQVLLTVIGTASSPEFIYPIKDSSMLMPDPENFGIFMLERHQAQQILNMSGQINQVLIEFTQGADEDQVVSAIKDILRPYGNLAAYPRSDQLSHAMLQMELDGLRSVSTVLPVMFLAIAAAIQFVIQRRMVKIQRTEIGVLKALGYSNKQIIWHYTFYGVGVALAGSLVGVLLGLVLSGMISQVYTQYFNLPGGLQRYNYKVIISGLALSLGVGMAAGWTSSRSILYLNPAQAMRPEPPKSSGKSWLEYWPWLWQRLGWEWKMSLRSISRNRGRFMLTLAGVVFAVGLLVVALFTNDVVDYLIQKHFYKEQQYDLLVRFEKPLKDSESYYISRIPGVNRVEPLLEVPVKLHYMGQSEEDVLMALFPHNTLKKISTPTGQALGIPADGILISERTARKLGVKVGEQVEVETLLPWGPVHHGNIKIVGINRQLIGGGSYTGLESANRLLQERNVITAVMIKVYPGQLAQVEQEINKMLAVATVQSRDRELAGFTKNMSSTLFAVGLMVFFALVLGIAIVFNSSLMSFVERQREIASLRVIGFTKGEVSNLLFKESVIQCLAGILLGLPFGQLMVRSYVNSAATDLYTFPVVIYPLTYVLAATGGIIFTLVAHQLALKGLKKLNLVEVLKNTD